MIQPWHAMILGIVEGLTEFLPVSSTGHLILAGWLLHLHGEAVKTFEVVIQAGSLLAVIGLYRPRLVSMWNGLCGHDAAGRRLLGALFISFLPAAVVGLRFHRVMTERLFGIGPVIGALAIGGVLMIGVDAWMRHQPASHRSLESMGWAEALVIGAAQCASLWPGTSRAMVTIVAALLLGFPATVAAEYSFLLALPTLGAATVFDAAKGGRALLAGSGGLSIVCGLATASIIAALAIRGFLAYLSRRGLAPFGWYRIGLAALIWTVVPHS